MRGRKSWRLLLFGAGASVIAVIAVLAFIAVAQGVPTGGSGTTSLPCSPQPCLDLQNFTIWVSNASSPFVQNAPGCTHWSRTEFGNGAKLGPLTICFRPASTAAPLKLRWSPDFGFFCCRADLKIK